MDEIEALVTVAAILATFFAVYFLVRNDVVRRSVSCPLKGAQVDLEVLHRGFRGEGRPLRAKSCSAFGNPRKIECRQECLRSHGA